MILSNEQIEELLKLIDFKHVQFLSGNLGTEILTNSDRNILLEHGVKVDDLPKTGQIDTAFKFGILSTILEESKLQKVTYEQLKQYVELTKGVPLSQQEKFALNNIRQRTYSDIKGLGNKIKKDITDIVIKESLKQRVEYEEVLRDTFEEGLLSRKTISQIVSDIGHKTSDWSRDFGRISDYVMHEAFDTGRAESIKKDFGNEALVYKQVFNSACKHCIRLYTTDGIGSEPIVFKVEELLANGNNIGRKTVDWLPVVGATHPFCRCLLQRKPEGFDWDENTRSFSKPNGERKVQRQSKAKIFVGGKEI